MDIKIVIHRTVMFTAMGFGAWCMRAGIYIHERFAAFEPMRPGERLLVAETVGAYVTIALIIFFWLLPRSMRRRQEALRRERLKRLVQ